MDDLNTPDVLLAKAIADLCTGKSFDVALRACQRVLVVLVGLMPPEQQPVAIQSLVDTIFHLCMQQPHDEQAEPPINPADKPVLH